MRDIQRKNTSKARTYKKIRKQSVTDQVFSALRSDIQDGVFKAGERLPSEAVLSEKMGVSRSSIKAAVQRLMTLGLAESRKGEGIFVLEFDANQYLEQMSEFLLDVNDIRAITEYRMYFEMAAVRLAVRNATEKNFKRMEEILGQMEAAVGTDDVNEHGRLDYEFHLELCRATGNDIFVLSYKIIGKMLMQHAILLNHSFFDAVKRFGSSDDIHRGIMEALRARDINACREWYARMFSVYETLPQETIRSS